MLVAGIDAHATYSVIAIVSNTGQLVAGPIRIKNTQEDRLDDLLQRYQPLEAVEGEICEYRAEAQSDLKHFGTKPTNDLAHLEAVVMSADARPTQQSYEVYEEISNELAEQLSRLEQVLVDDLESFNVLLRERNLTPIGRLIA